METDERLGGSGDSDAITRRTTSAADWRVRTGRNGYPGRAGRWAQYDLDEESTVKHDERQAAARTAEPPSAVRNLVRAAFGGPPFAAQHLLRQRYLRRHTQEVERFSDNLPPVQPATDGTAPQTRDDGCGPILARTHSVTIRDSRMTPAELMTRFRHAPNEFVPRHIAGFFSQGEPACDLVAGDELVVEIPGPWNGPIRVDSANETEVMLITLPGHMEAGHIRFRTRCTEDGDVEFEIRSWARAGDELFRRLHVGVKLAHEAQTAMWAHTCDRAVAVSGGRRHSAILSTTETLLGSSIESDEPQRPGT